jgi:hypothetical protein
VRITNHSSHRRSYQVTLHLPEGMTLVSGPKALSLAAGKSGSVRVQVQLPASPGNYLVTADVHSEGMAFNRWVEALVTVPE